jgi:hypothetical protein
MRPPWRPSAGTATTTDRALAYERRERVLPEHLRRTVIGKNGDVLAAFLVDGMASGRRRVEEGRP